MYRLLIVDDERLIADGIYEVLQNSKDLELDIYKAYSAKEALTLLKTARIDIAMTDIRMPGMDGMRLLQIMKDMWPQCRIIILTGYSQFDYIYQAVQYPGVSYLLKSEGYDKIIACVREIITDIEKSVHNADMMNKAHDEIRFNLAFIQKDYLSSILTRLTMPNDINQDQFDEYGIPLDAALPVLLLLGQTDSLTEDKGYSEKMKLLYGIRSVSQEYFAGQVCQVQIPYEKNDLIWFIQPNRQDKREWGPDVWHDTAVFISGVLETVQSVCRDSMGVSISFVISGGPTAWQEVPVVYDRLRIFFERWANKAEGFIYTLAEREDLRANARGAAGTPPWGEIQTRISQIEILERYLETRQQQKFFALFHDITEPFAQIDNKRDICAIQLYYSLTLMFLRYINRNGLSEKLASQFGLDGLTHLDDHAPWLESISYLSRLSGVIFEMAGSDEEYRYANVINRLKGFIQQNISEDLSLVRLSGFAHFNPSYLSRLFKRLTNLNLSDFINETRLRKAKDLLVTDMKIHEVAAAVGYESPKNFARFFKRQTNMTPQEYKDLSK